MTVLTPSKAGGITKWESEDHHCPHCGIAGQLWYEADSWDYYDGESYYCLNCDQNHSVHLYQGKLDPEVKALILKAMTAGDARDPS